VESGGLGGCGKRGGSSLGRDAAALLGKELRGAPPAATLNLSEEVMLVEESELEIGDFASFERAAPALCTTASPG
jgi:hypothetical protein